MAAHGDEWAGATRHPFLDAIRKGSLSDSAFRVWLQQDYHFLGDLLDFEASLIARAPSTARQTLEDGIEGVKAEIDWFKSVAAQRHLTLDTPRHTVTDAYRQHLASAAESWSSGMTTLWAGERGYLEAWQSARPARGRHAEFVVHWTAPEFVAYVRDLERLLGTDGDEDAFVATCRLEKAFWDMAWATAES